MNGEATSKLAGSFAVSVDFLHQIPIRRPYRDPGPKALGNNNAVAVCKDENLADPTESGIRVSVHGCANTKLRNRLQLTRETVQ